MPSRSHLLRTFIALDISKAMRREISQLIERLESPDDGARWASSQEMHITLCFLGEMELNTVPAVCQAAAKAAASCEPFTLQVCGLGAFPSLERPRTLWAGVGIGREELVAFQASMEQAMSGLGFRAEARAYTPHLTLGRVRKAGSDTANLPERLAEQAEFDAGGFRVEQAILYSSQLTPEGPDYTVLGRAKLGA